MVAHVKEITSTRSAKLSRGPKYKRKVMDSQRWFGSVIGLIKNLCVALEWSNLILVHFWAHLWIVVQSEIWMILASYNSHCEQTMMNQRLKFKSYILLYTKKM